MDERIDRIGVLGGGIMGSGIAEVCVLSGARVIVAEANDEAANGALTRMQQSFNRAVERGKLDDDTRSSSLERLSVTTDVEELADCQLVVEAVVEDEGTKVALFRTLDAILTDPDAILASNTSSIPIINLAMATGRREHIIGLHFFNPAPVQPLVEIVPTLLTAERTVERMESFVAVQLGKNAVRSKDRAGFIVNALLVPYMLNAIRMFESGFASAEAIDTGMVAGCAHPLGPLALLDLVGLDTAKAVAESLYEEFKEPLYAPPPLLSRMVSAGLLGRKSGQGFYTYTDQ